MIHSRKAEYTWIAGPADLPMGQRVMNNLTGCKGQITERQSSRTKGCVLYSIAWDNGTTSQVSLGVFRPQLYLRVVRPEHSWYNLPDLC